MNIYVSNLGFNFRDEELNQLFAAFGTVSSAKIIMDKATGKSRGFGFVEMPNDAEAKNAISELNDKITDGRPIKVNEARPKEERNNGNRSSFKKW